MAFFIDMSCKVDYDRHLRAEAAKKTNSDQPLTSVTMEERLQGWEEVTLGPPPPSPPQNGTSHTLSCSPLLTPYTAPSTPSTANDNILSLTAHTTISWTPEQDPVLQRLGWRQKVKEFFRPGLRKKRALEEFAISQRLVVHIENPVEAPVLPAAGLEKLKEREETLVGSVVGSRDEDGKGGEEKGEDEDVTALPPMSGHEG